MKKILVIILNLILVPSIFAEPPIFVDKFSDAKVIAEEQHKDLLLVFSADWCGACKKMKKDLDLSPNIIDDMIVCYIITDNNRLLAKQYKVKTIPDYLVIRDNTTIKRQNGYNNIAEFSNWLHSNEQ